MALKYCLVSALSGFFDESADLRIVGNNFLEVFDNLYASFTLEDLSKGIDYSYFIKNSPISKKMSMTYECSKYFIIESKEDNGFEYKIIKPTKKFLEYIKKNLKLIED